MGVEIPFLLYQFLSIFSCNGICVLSSSEILLFQPVQENVLHKIPRAVYKETGKTNKTAMCYLKASQIFKYNPFVSYSHVHTPTSQTWYL